VIYWQLAAAITFASFTAIVYAVSLAFRWAAPAIACRVEERTPVSRATGLFGLRVLPYATGLFAAFGIVLPMFLWFEPSDTQEPLGATLAVAGAAGALWLSHGACRALRSWRATRTLAREWRSSGRRLDTFDVPVPVFAIEERYPLVAVVGFLRPELFISQRVLLECPPDEVRAMILHECAHIAAADNIKRLVLRACPDVWPATPALETLWARAAEEAADAAAAASGPALRLDLAQALVRVARLATGAHRPLPASAFYLGGSIESRVRRLIDPTEPATSAGVPVLLISVLLAISALVAVTASAPALHDAIEAIVRTLP
jgi:Zn-dependent protease with chaperone function